MIDINIVKTVQINLVALGLTTALSLATFSGQSATLMSETFNNGTPGGTPETTSDGSGSWLGQLGTYGGTVENPNYYMVFEGMSFSAMDYPVGSSTGVNNITNYSVKFGTLKLGGELTTGVSSYIAICTRKTNLNVGFGYEFRPDTVDTNDNRPTAWKISYLPTQGDTPVKFWTIPGASPTLTNVEIRVLGNQMRLYIDGVPLDVALRPTQGAPGQGGGGLGGPDYQRALEIICNTAPPNIVEATVDDITITTPEAQPPFEDSVAGTLLAYDGFDYAAGAYLHEVSAGGFGWTGPYTKGEQYGNRAAFIANPVYGTENAPRVLTPGATHPLLHTLGNLVSTTNYRTMRYFDVDHFPAELKEGNGTVIRKTGKSIWMSALMHQASTNAGFFGVSLFNNSTEIAFLGKAGGITAGAVVWKVEGKFPNTMGLTTKSPLIESLLLVKIEWNHDGTTYEHYTTNATVITTNRIPVNPDKMYIWVNPNVDHPSATLDVATADAVSVRNSTATPTEPNPNDPYLAFNRIGIRGQANSDGRIDEVRIGTTFRAVLPSDRSELDVHASKQGENLVLRWKTKAGFVLQSTDALSPTNWTPVAGTPQSDGLDSVLTVTPSGGPKFYRLAGQ